MKSLILAAGRGSRMASSTNDAPKCFTTLAGKKLIQWQIEALKIAGLDEIFAIGGYQKEKLKNEIKVPYVNENWSKTNSVRTLLEAKDLLMSEECIISYSDILYHPQHIIDLINSEGDLKITYDSDWLELWSLRSNNPLTDAETFRQNKSWVSDIGGKPESLQEIQGQYMGLIYSTPKSWRAIINYLKTISDYSIDKMDMTSLLSNLLNISVDIKAVAVNGKWCEVDTEKDLALYQKKINDKIKWSHDWRW